MLQISIQIPNSWHFIIHKLSVAHRNLHRLHTYGEVQNTHTPIKTKDTKCVEKINSGCLMKCSHLWNLFHKQFFFIFQQEQSKSEKKLIIKYYK